MRKERGCDAPTPGGKPQVRRTDRNQRPGANAERRGLGGAALASKPCFSQLATLLFSGAAPNARFLIRGERKFQTVGLCFADSTDRLRRFDLVDCLASRPDREEQLWISVSARRARAPVVTVPIDGSVPREGHADISSLSYRRRLSNACSRPTGDPPPSTYKLLIPCEIANLVVQANVTHR